MEQQHTQLIERPIVIAICGKSAVGKDTLARWLTTYFSSLGLYTHNMISCTTRPPRAKEEDGEDYYFLNDEEFIELIHDKSFIECTMFRGWHYGVRYNEVKSGRINIGVFNVGGLKSLESKKIKYHIIPIYLNEKLSTRLRRSREREGRWRLEYFRRAITDFFEFRNVKKTLGSFNGKYIMLDKVDGVWKQGQIIANKMMKWGILIKDKETNEMRLGNFI